MSETLEQREIRMKAWTNRIIKNITVIEDEINNNTDLDPDEFLVILQRQYSLIALLRGVLTGDVQLHGFDFDSLPNTKT